MMYLHKVFYADKKNFESVHKSRFDFEETLKTKLYIKPYGHEKIYQLYYVYNRETARFIDRIRQNDTILNDLQSKLPVVAQRAFLVEIISAELQSTNELEGVQSSKDEIAETTRKRVTSGHRGSERFSSMINSYFLLKDSLKAPKDLGDIRKIYDEITAGEIKASDRPDGHYFRKEAVYVQKMNAVDGEVIHRGILGEAEIEREVLQLLGFISDERIDLLLRIAIAHYYFGYIHPFYDGNGRVSRFISSLYLVEKYNYLTAMSLARGSWIKKRDYYKAFSTTNLSQSRGEMNYFIDSFLKLLIAGQEDIIDYLNRNLDKLNRAEACIEESELETKFKRTAMLILAQNYHFDYNSGIERRELMDFFNEEISDYKGAQELDELEKSGYIKRIKSRPITYVLGDTFLQKL